MNQIVIAIKEENILIHLTLFDNSPESYTPFSERRLRDKELWDPGYTEFAFWSRVEGRGSRVEGRG